MMLEAADAVSIALGASAAAWLRAHDVGGQELGDLLKAYDRGITQGTWHGVVRAGARVAAADNAGPPGLASAGRSSKKGTLLAHLTSLLQERNNWAHGAGPRSSHEAGIRLATFLPVLESALAGCSFLSAAPWMLTQSSSFRARTRDFEVAAFSAMSDHPEFERRRFTSTVPLADNRFYMLLDGGEPVDLTPFVVLRHCELCGRPEVFYSDRLSDGGVVLKSFGSGHPQTDVGLGEELRAIVEPSDPRRSTG